MTHPPTTPLPQTATETRMIERAGAHLVTVHKDGMQAVMLRKDRPLRIGRSIDCDIRLDTPLLSRVHFSVTAGSDGKPATLRDLGSSNGTKVNGQLVTPHEPIPLEAGAFVEAGAFFLLKGELALDGGANDRDTLAPSDAPPRSPRATEEPAPLKGVIVADPAMRQLHELVELVARSNIAVLVSGETGSGKDIVSAAVHARSPRAANPFVSLNCAALPETLLESELFGYERGAFTGATQAKQGLIESAHEGTLFLDEIGEMPMATQAKLLRVLENGELTRIGALKPRVVDVRFIAATNRDLPALVVSGAFRRDLYFRLNGITIPVPPLRHRPSEIAPLALHFVEQAARRANRRTPRLAPEVLPLLLSHPWPGNIRELRNVIDRAVALCSGDVVRVDNVVLDPPMPPSVTARASSGIARIGEGDRTTPVTPSSVHPSSANGSARPPFGTIPTPVGRPGLGPLPPPGENLGRLLRIDADTERRLIEEALERARGNQSKAAELLGVSRRTLINRLDQYEIARPRKRPSAV